MTDTQRAARRATYTAALNGTYIAAQNPYLQQQQRTHDAIHCVSHTARIVLTYIGGETETFTDKRAAMRAASRVDYDLETVYVVSVNGVHRVFNIVD